MRRTGDKGSQFPSSDVRLMETLIYPSRRQDVVGPCTGRRNFNLSTLLAVAVLQTLSSKCSQMLPFLLRSFAGVLSSYIMSGVKATWELGCGYNGPSMSEQLDQAKSNKNHADHF